MKHPWETISLSDYENHMKEESVRQLQTLNEILRDQVSRYPVSAVTILGVAGGNGLEHVPGTVRRVYGVDVNSAYLAECINRFPNLAGIFQPVCLDLLEPDAVLPEDSDLLIADLLVEYIGCAVFQRHVRNSRPRYISCVIQQDPDGAFVSGSPYLHAFDPLEAIHHSIRAENLSGTLAQAGYQEVLRETVPLPNGKRFIRLDYQLRATFVC